MAKIEHFYQTVGEDWFTYPNLYASMVEHAENGQHFVEVGSWKGRSSVFMAVEIANSEKDIIFHCIDPWHVQHNILIQDDHEEDWLYNDFLSNIEPVKEYITPVRLSSVEAASLYEDESLDFVFIDAAHDYDSVKADITAWLPKVKIGGTIGGHDYEWSEDVQRAAHEVIGRDIKQQEGCWLLEKGRRKKIVDCFTFYNEFDMLELHLKELYDTVDFFVISESTVTFSGVSKELFFENNKERFSQYLDKIVHVIVDDTPETDNRWDREAWQRGALMRGLVKLDLNEDDLVLVTDCDEICNVNTLESLRKYPFRGIMSLEQDIYYYNFNCRCQTKWYHVAICSYSTLKEIGNPDKVRNSQRTQHFTLGGWHLSYFFDEKNIADKIHCFSHSEYDTDYYTSEERIKDMIMNNVDLFERDIKYDYIPLEHNNWLPVNKQILLK